MVSKLSEPGPILTNQEPAISSGILHQSDREVTADSVNTITYITINRMPAGSGFKLAYPWTVDPALTLTTCLVWYKNVAFP